MKIGGDYRYNKTIRQPPCMDAILMFFRSLSFWCPLTRSTRSSSGPHPLQGVISPRRDQIRRRKDRWLAWGNQKDGRKASWLAWEPVGNK